MAKETKNEKLARELRAASRANMLAHQAANGRPRAEVWSGQPEKGQKQTFRRKARRDHKLNLKKGDF